MFARDLMTKPVITCHVNDSVNEVAQRMMDGGVGSLVVVNDEGKLTSVITDRDICMAALTHQRTLDEILVNQAMAKSVVSARPDSTINEVSELMATHRVRRIPIVDADGNPIGVVALDDLVIESVQPDTALLNGASRVAHTLAAICRPT